MIPHKTVPVLHSTPSTFGCRKGFLARPLPGPPDLQAPDLQTAHGMYMICSCWSDCTSDSLPVLNTGFVIIQANHKQTRSQLPLVRYFITHSSQEEGTGPAMQGHMQVVWDAAGREENVGKSL